MSGPSSGDISEPRVAGVDEAAAVGRLLHDFQSEFGHLTPGPEVLAQRIGESIEVGQSTFVVIGSPPVGLAQLRFRDSVITGEPDAYLEELYVAPAERNRGRGRALLERTLEVAREIGAARIDLGTAVGDEAARHLYESLGFTNFETPGDESSRMLFYERDL